MSIKRKLIITCSVLLTLLFTSSPATSQENGYKEVTAPEAKMIQEKNSDALIINVLSKLEFELQHLPGSISIPINEFQTTTLLPDDKAAPVLTYCMGAR